jgi:hypothetical protein
VGVPAIAPSYSIYIEAGQPGPVVINDALNSVERCQLGEWLEKHPALADLVQRAISLADEAAVTARKEKGTKPSQHGEP